MGQWPSWEANRSSATQEIPRILPTHIINKNRKLINTYNNNKHSISIRGYCFERVNNVPYLVSVISHNDIKILQKIKEENKVYCTLKSLITSKLINKQTKKKLF
jgi:hypothetical protein